MVKNMSLVWKFQRGNEPKHSSNLTKAQFLDYTLDVIEWAGHFLDLSLIENVWIDLKRQIFTEYGITLASQ